MELFHQDLESTPVERGKSTLIAYQEQDMEPEFLTEDTKQLSQEELNIFAELRLNKHLEEVATIDNMEDFAQPLLEQSYVHQQVDLIERLDGKSKRQASSISNELVKDMAVATHYPPEIPEMPTAEELAKTTDDIISHIVLKKEENDDDDDDDDFLDDD